MMNGEIIRHKTVVQNLAYGDCKVDVFKLEEVCTANITYFIENFFSMYCSTKSVWLQVCSILVQNVYRV